MEVRAWQQGPLGALTLKPTSWIFFLNEFRGMVHFGPLQFSTEDKCAGPLPAGQNPAAYSMVRKADYSKEIEGLQALQPTLLKWAN